MPCITVNVAKPLEVEILAVAEGLSDTIKVGSVGVEKSIVVAIKSNKETYINLRLTATMDGKTIHDKTYKVLVSPDIEHYYIDNISIPGKSGTLKICASIGEQSKCRSINIVLVKPDIRVTDLKIIYNGKEVTTVPLNEVFKVQATLKNYGDEGSCDYVLTIDGKEISRHQITLGKGESKVVSMQTRILTAGTHKVCVDTQC